MNDRRSIIALLIIGVLLLLTPTYMRLFYGPSQPVPADSTRTDSEVQTAFDTGQMRVKADSTGEEERITVSEPELIALTTDPSNGRFIVVETPLYTATLSTRGAVFLGWQLEGFGREGEDIIVMVPRGAMGPVIEVPMGDERISSTSWIFQSNSQDTIQVGKDEDVEIILETEVAEGKRISRTVRFSGARYDVLIKDTFWGFEASPMNDAYRLMWLGGLAFTEEKRQEDLQYSGFYGYQGEDIDKQKLKKDAVDKQLFGYVDWVAIRTKYFASILIPQGEPFRNVRMNGEAGDTGPAIMNVAADRPIPTGEEGSVETLLYMGPVDYRILKGYEIGLDEMMDFGFSIIRPISKLVLKLFLFLHEFIPNYGIVIIIFSILVKVVVFPLTRKSYESMHAMQELAPKMQEIKEKHKDDPEKMNRKIMNLYKENKVNPLGGCFPLLLQMPVFWALFIVFRTTIELRGAPFVLWLTDLSMKDPYMVLPALMGLTMLFQQRTQLKDPRQRPMALIMPVALFFLFMSFPAGLILYWTLFNVLSIIQTELVHKRPAPVKT